MIDYQDTYAWSKEQAFFLKTGQFEKLDVDHLADEILDVGKSEKRELENRLANLIMHLLKVELQPNRNNSPSWKLTIVENRKRLKLLLKKQPSLKPNLTDSDFVDAVIGTARVMLSNETGIVLNDFQVDLIDVINSSQLNMELTND